jgi:protein-S-isoprenylcysteine O-methyltransferase Ste14
MTHLDMVLIVRNNMFEHSKTGDPMRFVLLVLCVEAAILSILFAAAGRYDLPWCWAVAVVHGFCMGIYIRAMDPDLRRERLKPGGDERDRWLRLAIIPLVLIHLVIAGLDLRFGWSGAVSPVIHVAGLAVIAAAMLLGAWAVRTNRFFSSVVRIQYDRGHHVITSGPYRLIRHPGYLSLLSGAVGGAMAIGSWWSLLPLLPLVLVVATRAWREERLLMQSLAGYAEYAQSVRFRLLPGVW